MKKDILALVTFGVASVVTAITLSKKAQEVKKKQENKLEDNSESEE